MAARHFALRGGRLRGLLSDPKATMKKGTHELLHPVRLTQYVRKVMYALVLPLHPLLPSVRMGFPTVWSRTSGN